MDILRRLAHTLNSGPQLHADPASEHADRLGGQSRYMAAGSVALNSLPQGREFFPLNVPISGSQRLFTILPLSLRDHLQPSSADTVPRSSPVRHSSAGTSPSYLPLLERLVNPTTDVISNAPISSAISNTLLMPDWPGQLLHYLRISSDAPLAAPELLQQPLLDRFLENHPRCDLAVLIQRVARFAQTALNKTPRDRLGERLQKVVTHYENYPESRDSLNNVAHVSTTNCHDGDLGGLIEIEKHLDTLKLIEAVNNQYMDKDRLLEAGKKHFALRCIEDLALKLCGAMGSTSEAVELDLFLIKELSTYVDLPVSPIDMQNARYAQLIFNSAFMKVYPTSPMGLINTLESGSASTESLLENRLNLCAQNLRQKTNDKQQLLSFMASWPPAQRFIDQQKTVSCQQTAAVYHHLEHMLSLAQKTALNPEDVMQIKSTLSFLHDHRHSLPRGLFKKLAAATAPAGQLRTMTDELTTDFVQAITAVKNDLDSMPYRKALQALYPAFNEA